MKNIELQAARKLLMLETKEAAELIGTVSTRTWQYWEKGQYAIPDDVAGQIEDLIQLRSDMMERRKKEAEQAGDDYTINYYRTIEDFKHATGKDNVVMWRLTQSVAATLFTEYKAKLT
jgi:DNA-binding XRE family transcriptional regulator